jgi:ElaB/YqjD/DUF883 family membrane-anchored ribosome-binding protein
MTRTGTDKFFSDLRAAIGNAEELLHSATGDLGEARQQARDKLREAGERIGELEQELLSGARARARAADDYVQDNPWRSIAVAAGLALAIGVLLGRRR